MKITVISGNFLDFWKTKIGKFSKIRLHAAASRHRVDWRWVKGHAGDPDNERVDGLARDAAQQVRDAATLN